MNICNYTSSLQGAADKAAIQRVKDPPGTFPTPWNAGFVEIAWATVEFTGELSETRNLFARANRIAVRAPTRDGWDISLPQREQRGDRGL